MSIESANRFLNAVTDNEPLRHRFDQVQTPEDFVSLAQEMGFNFTTHELTQIVLEGSRGIEIRRVTGIWKWLRHTKWSTREHFAEIETNLQMSR